jgi:para-nitrobenzyl esterase
MAAFGGDPSNITVFGQSAGAMSTQTLVSSPLAKPYIAKAIMQSGGSYGCGLHRDMPLSEQEHYGQMFAEVAGVESLDEMRALSANRVLALIPQFFEKAMPEAQGLFLTPTIDGQVLTGGYYELMDEGFVADVPYLLGSTKNDVLVDPEITKPEDSLLYRGSIAFAHKLEDLGRTPAYVYYFTRDLPGDDQGAWHSSELWYTMGTLDRCWRPWSEGDRALAGRILDYWTNFMKSGNPNGAGLPSWKPCDKAESFVMELDV